MGFSFGASAQIGSENCKSLAGKSEVFKSPVIFDHTTGEKGNYYIFLVEGNVWSSTKNWLINKIKDAGYSNYIILSATVIPFVRSEIKQLSAHMKDYESSWKSYIDYKGMHASAIMCFGAALYGINKGTDLMVDCFYSTHINKSYYYLGDRFLGKFNTFIFPVDSIDNIVHLQYAYGKEQLPPSYYAGEKYTDWAKKEVDFGYITWKTRFFELQLLNMKKEKKLPNLEDYTIYRASEV